MSVKYVQLSICLLLFLPALVQAQGVVSGDGIGLTFPGGAGNALPGQVPGISLLDPQRFQMSQSYGLMYSYSSQGSSGDLVGLYQNMLSYRFSPRLDVKIGLGYLHRPVAAFSNTSAIGHQALMTAFQVDFRPFDNIFIHFQYQSLPMVDDRDPLWRYHRGWDPLGP